MKRIWLLILGICVIGSVLPTLAGKGDKGPREKAKQAGTSARLNIAKFDRNGNGVLDPEERTRFASSSRPRLDTSKDGKLDKNELAASSHQAARQERSRRSDRHRSLFSPNGAATEAQVGPSADLPWNA